MPSNRFTNKVVLITGGTSGLGFATASLFLQEGAKVLITDLHDRSILTQLGSPQNAHFQKCDISSPSDCSAAIKTCIAHFGRLDILFHNAGRIAEMKTVVDHDIPTFDAVIQTNLSGLFYLARAAIPEMRKHGKGAIISTASTSGLYGDQGLCSYSASKAGLINLTRTMALDHAHEGIRVNCVCPGYMITPMTDAFRSTEGMLEAVLESIPMHRGAEPEEVGRAVLFLASDDASFITGQALAVDGGMTASTGCASLPKLFTNAEAKKAKLNQDPV